MSEQTTTEAKQTEMIKANGAAKAIDVKGDAKEKELDKAVASYLKGYGKTRGAAWDLGGEITAIYDNHLWKARRTEEGKPQYTEWSQFCKAELGISHTAAYDAMDMHKFFTRDKVIELGPSKSKLLLQAPPEVREQLEKEAAKHSKRELAQKVKNAKAEGGNKRRETGRRNVGKGKTGAERAEAKPIGAKLSVAVLTEKKSTIKLWAGKTGEAESKRAKSIAALPTGYVDLANGLRMFVAVIDHADGWQAKVQFSRVDDEGNIVRE